MDLRITRQVTPAAVILRCAGRLVAGPEIQALENALGHRYLDRYIMVLNLRDVSRLDSTGMGALVRSSATLDQQGKSLRLAVVPKTLLDIFRLTRTEQVLHFYVTEDQALHAAHTSSAAEPRNPKQRILFYDSSPDLCAFISGVLGQAGFEVHTTCSLRDARILLEAGRMNRVLLGPGTPQMPSAEAARRLKSAMPNANLRQLAPDFRTRDAEAAAQVLLEMFVAAARS